MLDPNQEHKNSPHSDTPFLTRLHLSSLRHTSPLSDSSNPLGTSPLSDTFPLWTHLSPLGHTSSRLKIYTPLLTRTSSHSDTPLTSPLSNTSLFPRTPLLTRTTSPHSYTPPLTRIHLFSLGHTTNHSDTHPLTHTHPSSLGHTSPHSYTPLLTQNLGSARDVLFINLSITIFQLRFDIMIQENDCYQTYTKT